METPDKIKKGLEMHALDEPCTEHSCHYYGGVSGKMCTQVLTEDALAYIQQLEIREWDLFDLLSSAWYGKGCYFKQDDGTVYSRVSCEYMSFDQAIDEFANKLTVEGESIGKDTNVPRWISVKERLPEKREIVVVTDGTHAWDYGEFMGLAFYFDNDNPNLRKWNWKKHTVKHVEWWMPKKTALPEAPKEG